MINPHHNLPPGCGTWETGTSDVYVCETCGDEVSETELDQDAPDGDLRCKACGARAAFEEAEQIEAENLNEAKGESMNDTSKMAAQYRVELASPDEEADAQAELEAERLARAKALKMARARVTLAMETLREALSHVNESTGWQFSAIFRASTLLDALDALKRLEDGEDGR